MELEKDFLQLTTDQKKYGEGLPRPESRKKIFFSEQPTRRRHMGKDYRAQAAQGAGKDFIQLTTDQKKVYGEGEPRPGSWKRLSSTNNRPEEGIWGRITAPGELEKDFLQLTTDQQRAYGEGLPRPWSSKKMFFS